MDIKIREERRLLIAVSAGISGGSSERKALVGAYLKHWSID